MKTITSILSFAALIVAVIVLSIVPDFGSIAIADTEEVAEVIAADITWAPTLAILMSPIGYLLYHIRGRRRVSSKL
jgi:hypothetical protein